MREKNQILVEVQPEYLAMQSEPNKKKYVFSYTITLTNIGLIPATLLSRRWIITDSNGRIEAVEGTGVVGKTPYLKSGESFSYTSGVLLDTSVGVMSGLYNMRSEEGDFFDAIIPRFTLSIPRTLH